MGMVEILVATMHQKDFSKIEEMHIQSDVIFANQADSIGYESISFNGHIAQLLTTTLRGVGLNRNHALLYTTGDYLVFADDDLCYNENYPALIQQAFQNIPDADMIIFDLDYLNTLTGIKRHIKKINRVHWYNALRYGTARIAVKRIALQKANVWFSSLYGGGAEHYSGEDNLFVIETLKKGLKVYTYPAVIASVKQTSSTWFEGFNEKYFIDKGYLLANMFPYLCHPLCLYYAYKLRNTSEDFTSSKIYGLLRQGVQDYKKGISR